MFVFVDINKTVAYLGEAVKAYMPRLLEFCRELGFSGTEEEFFRAVEEVDRWEHDLLFNREQAVPNGGWFMKLGETLGLEMDWGVAALEETNFVKFVSGRARLVEGAEEGIVELSGLAPLFTLSQSYTRTVLEVLHTKGLLKHFAGVVPMREMHLRKDERGYGELVRKFGRGHIIIGDSRRKEGLAEKFGWKFVDVGRGWERAVEEVRSYIE